MQRRALLAIVCVSVAACAPLAVARGSVGGEPPPPETVLPAPPVEAVGKAATPWMRAQLARLRGPLRPARRPPAHNDRRLEILIPAYGAIRARRPRAAAWSSSR